MFTPEELIIRGLNRYIFDLRRIHEKGKKQKVGIQVREYGALVIETLQGTVRLIIIAHRLSTIRKCDKIYAVKDGNIIEREKVRYSHKWRRFLLLTHLVKWRNQVINFLRLKHNKIHYGKELVLNGLPIFGGNVYIGDRCRINSGMQYNPIGGDNKTMLLAYDGEIRIGNNVGMSNTTIVSKSSIIIEDNVRIGGSCKIYDTDFHSMVLEERLLATDPGVVSKPINIKEGAFIGAHTIVLKGVTIGKESVVGAGSVVSKSIPDGEIWAGNPARFIKRVGEK